MFKVGDNVVCIRDNNMIIKDQILIKYKVYKIDKIITPTRLRNDHFDEKKYFLMVTNNIVKWNPNRFILLNEYRKLKLQKLCSKKEIK